MSLILKSFAITRILLIFASILKILQSCLRWVWIDVNQEVNGTIVKERDTRNIPMIKNIFL